MQHPYRGFPARHFWAKSVAVDYDPAAVGDFPAPLIRPKDYVVTAGSCFAVYLIPYLERANFKYLRTAFTHPVFAKIPGESLNYSKFSAAYGNIYTARQLYQLLLRCLGEFSPVINYWTVGRQYVDPYRPGLRYAARSEREFNVITSAHLRSVKQAFTECDTFIFTLGLTEAWVSASDGAVFPACPGTIAGEYDPQRHKFANFTVDEVIGDLKSFIRRLREINSGVRVILTVSPVPLVATATGRHVLSSTIYSKSVLRVAAETACREFEDVHYFPAYEIVTGPQAPEDFFEHDKRNVSRRAVETVMSAFLAACNLGEVPPVLTSDTSNPIRQQQLSAQLLEIECEEAAHAVF
jgi:GSCFA family